MSGEENRPYSLTNPSNAPKKKKTVRTPLRERRLGQVPRLRLEEETPREPEWRVLANTGYIREKYLRWTPEDVKEIDDLDMLETLRSYYTPASQPQNHFEVAYFDLMLEAVNNRLYVL